MTGTLWMLIFSINFLLSIKLLLHLSPPQELQNFRKFYITTKTCLFTCLSNLGKPTLTCHYSTSLLVLGFLQLDHTYRDSTSFLTLRIQFFFLNLIHFHIMIAIVVVISASIMPHYHFLSVIGIIKI